MVTRVIIQTSWLRNLNLVATPLNEFYDPLSQNVVQLKRKLGFQDNMTTTLNHILPGNRIKLMMQYCQEEKQIQDACKILTDHCNYYGPIADRVREFIDNQNDTVSAMETCWSSVYWYKKNLVLGPLSSQRIDDPGQNIDWPILKQQTNNYQQTLNICNNLIQSGRGSQALRQFFKNPLARFTNVDWQRQTRKSDKWKVNGPSSLPANAGFAY